MQVAFRFGHSQVQHEFRPWINGKISGFPFPGGNPAAKLPNGKENETHPFWIISNNFFFNPKNFTANEDGKGWLNEVEGLINQKCPEADLRIENVLTNELFGAYEHKPITVREVGGMKEMLNITESVSILTPRIPAPPPL